MTNDRVMYDNQEIRCPRLGGPVTFSYCLQEAGDLPCPRTVSCWHLYFPVEPYLKHKLSKDQWESFQSHEPKDKVTTLVELIEEAKKAKRSDG